MSESTRRPAPRAPLPIGRLIVWSPGTVTGDAGASSTRVPARFRRRWLSATLPYEQVAPRALVLPARPPSRGYERPPKDTQNHVPDHAATLG